MPRVIAHRGARTERPENTVAAFARAVELGADGVELDVRPTADGALAVLHDADLPDGRPLGTVAAADLPATVPLLGSALVACGPLLVNVEIKSDVAAPAAPAFVEAVVAACRDWGGEVLVSSFDERVVDAARDLGVPTAQLTALLDRSVPDTIASVAGRGHCAWHPHHATVDAAGVAAAHGAGLDVNVWTVDDHDRIVALAGWGVDGVVTNDVAGALAALGR